MKKTAVILAISLGLSGYVYSVYAAPPTPPVPQNRPVQPPQTVKPPSQPTPVQRPVTQPTVQSPTQKTVPSSTVTKPSTPQFQKTQPSATGQPKPTFANTPTKSGPTVTTTKPLKTQVVPVFQPSNRSISLPGAPGSSGTAVVPKAKTFSGAKGVPTSFTAQNQATPVATRQNLAVATPVVARRVLDNVTAKTNQLKSATPVVKSDSQKVTDLVLQYTNVERAKQGLPPLKQSPALTQLAALQSNDQAAAGIMAHDSNKFPAGWATFNDRMAKVDFGGGKRSAAENVLKTSQSAIPTDKAGQEAYAKKMVDSWMNSPKHKENILSPNSQYLGVGLKDGYATQVFASSEGKLKVALPTTNSVVKNVTDNVKAKTTQPQDTASVTKSDSQKTVDLAIQRTNAERAKQGLKPMTYDETVTAIGRGTLIWNPSETKTPGSGKQQAKTGGATQLTDREVDIIGNAVRGSMEKAGFNLVNPSSKTATENVRSGATGASSPTSAIPTVTKASVAATKAAGTAAQMASTTTTKPADVTKELLSANPKTKAELIQAIQQAEQVSLPSLTASISTVKNQITAEKDAYSILSKAAGGTTDVATLRSLTEQQAASGRNINNLSGNVWGLGRDAKAVGDKLSQWKAQLAAMGSGTTSTQSAPTTTAGSAGTGSSKTATENIKSGATESSGTGGKIYGTGTKADPYRDYPDANKPPWAAPFGTGAKNDPYRDYEGNYGKNAPFKETQAMTAIAQKEIDQATDRIKVAKRYKEKGWGPGPDIKDVDTIIKNKKIQDKISQWEMEHYGQNTSPKAFQEIVKGQAETALKNTYEAQKALKELFDFAKEAGGHPVIDRAFGDPNNPNGKGGYKPLTTAQYDELLKKFSTNAPDLARIYRGFEPGDGTARSLGDLAAYYRETNSINTGPAFIQVSPEHQAQTMMHEYIGHFLGRSRDNDVTWEAAGMTGPKYLNWGGFGDKFGEKFEAYHNRPGSDKRDYLGDNYAIAANEASYALKQLKGQQTSIEALGAAGGLPPGWMPKNVSNQIKKNLYGSPAEALWR